MLGAAALMASACTPTTTIVRADGWRYDGRLLSSDADSVTIEGATGPIVIPRGEVVDYDLPGSGLLIAGGALAVGGVLAAFDGGDDNSTAEKTLNVLGIAIGAGLLSWGGWVWHDANKAWSGPATEVSVGAHGVMVRF